MAFDSLDSDAGLRRLLIAGWQELDIAGPSFHGGVSRGAVGISPGHHVHAPATSPADTLRPLGLLTKWR